MPYLTVDQVSRFQTEGYLVIENFWNDEVVNNLKHRIHEIVDQFELVGPNAPTSIFTTKEQRKHTDDYFLNSGYAIRFFWEENAWVDGKLTCSPNVAINKVGHGLHDIDPLFESATYDPRLGQICKELGMSIPLAVQSMYIFKQALVGGEVSPHQDGSYLYTEPQSVIGFWWPLDDCTKSNGCLWAVPGSQSIGVNRRFRRLDPPGIGTEFIPKEPEVFDKTGAIALEIPKGSLVILHHALVHFSEENKSNMPRHAYSVHVVDGRDNVIYPADNWLQRPEEHPFRALPSLD